MDNGWGPSLVVLRLDSPVDSEPTPGLAGQRGAVAPPPYPSATPGARALWTALSGRPSPAYQDRRALLSGLSVVRGKGAATRSDQLVWVPWALYR